MRGMPAGARAAKPTSALMWCRRPSKGRAGSSGIASSTRPSRALSSAAFTPWPYTPRPRGNSGAGSGSSLRAVRMTSAQRPSLHPFEHADVVRDRGAAHVEDAAELRVRDLHVAGLLAELHRAERVHGDAGRADRMDLGLEAAGRVDRQ